jgi:hypothetical protein
VVDPGTGSTYERVTSHPRADVLVPVRLTTQGRKLVWQAVGLSASKKAAVGELRQWHWRALCRAYVHDEQSMEYDSDTGDGFGYVNWNICLKLRDGRVGGQDRPLIREV